MCGFKNYVCFLVLRPNTIETIRPNTTSMISAPMVVVKSSVVVNVCSFS